MQNLSLGEHQQSKRRINAVYLREDAVVAELEQLGIHYINRHTVHETTNLRTLDYLLADIVRQPSSRVRNAVIALLLLHPEFAHHVPLALQRLRGENRLLLKIYYSAAFILQIKYHHRLQPFLQDRWVDLPDLFSSELTPNAQGSPEERLKVLGEAHQLRLGKLANWSGTYDNVAYHLIHQLELEAQWNR